MSESDDGNGDNAVEEEPTPLQRALDLLVFAPVGIALTVAEDLPGLVGKGHQRFEADVQNARIVGRIVVAQGQRQFIDRLSKLLRRASSDETDDESGSAAPAERAQGASGAAAAPSARPGLSSKPSADPADGVIVEGALAGYDTLSASQVVRRLESLGPDELTALQRYEASHRNRHTILNRAHQILEAIEAADEVPAGDGGSESVVVAEGTLRHSAVTDVATAQSDAPDGATPIPETPTPETPIPETPTPETVTPETVAPASPPPVATAPEPDRSVE